jgi:hypothetical protein
MIASGRKYNEIANYKPILKNRGFNPQPVAGNIPYEADSYSNPDCIGSHIWEEFWEEQYERCVHGYTTGGMKISGRYYFYLNFAIIEGTTGPMHPYFVDMQYDFFQLVEDVKSSNEAGIVCIKARRKGLSNMVQAGVIGHGIAFLVGYKAAVVAGLSPYVNGFRNKLNQTMGNLPPEFQMNILKDNEELLKIGYEEKRANGQFVEAGALTTINYASLQEQATKLEGEYFNDVVMEESGQFPLLSQAHSSIGPALKWGQDYKGTFYVYGTGGNILKSSKAFKYFWEHAESMRLRTFWVSARRMYFPFVGGLVDQYGNNISKIPNFDTKYQEHELIGVEDLVAAEESIKTERRTLMMDKTNKKKLIEFNQTMPLEVDEAFTTSGSNNFDEEILFSTLLEVEGARTVSYQEVVLRYILDEEGVPKLPLAVKMVPYNPENPEHFDWEIVRVMYPPEPTMKDYDVGGVDSYNEDDSLTSSSLGGMTVLRRNHIQGFIMEKYPLGLLIACTYQKRPPRKEQFYEITLKISIAYHLIKNCLVAADAQNHIDYFAKGFGLQFLALRPKSLDAPKSQMMNVYGVKMTVYSKPIMVGFLQSYILDYVYLCKDPQMIRELIAYDSQNIGTDWDLADSLGFALIRNVDMKRKPRSDESDQGEKDDHVLIWRNGQLVGAGSRGTVRETIEDIMNIKDGQI